MPLSNAKEIWLAAIGAATGIDPSKIDDTDNWEQYMTLTQLEKAYDDTTASLAAHYWVVSWSLAEVSATNPIKAQYTLLATRAKYTGGSGPVLAAVRATPAPTKRSARK